ncbi:hypothetical protein QTQ03_22550 [Micromonospora sp. WMMA1363]|uniref:hypothetical protein n=1 Tax=Micromonospora sp. WMMA1363 TaxID=3053985 RepID=UPI00259CA344|nr:hypothetical protein [Micromonospora sp. WMMA1363]MDM4722230.1 hypothetical protein [Micromonospora sp. WMMA1363]
MEVGRALLLTGMVGAVVCLPVVIALLFCADELIDRLVCGFGEWRERRREHRTIARLDQAVEADALTRNLDLSGFDRPDRRPLEQLAADLRRLGSQRVGANGRSAVWHGAVLRAYDERLRLACAALGISQHLDELTGVDREIERVRVEGLLHRAGLILPAAWAEHRQRHR